jgi:carbon-monoxide dehydrogenase medium subunit
MIPTEFDYKRASTVAEAVRLLKDANGDGRLLAGGHSLIPLMKLRLSEPTLLIDIAGLPDLRGISESAGQITIGAVSTHHDVEVSDLLLQHVPVVAEAASEIGDVQVRNRGTLGGSLAHSDPASDQPAVMVALGAQFDLTGGNGQRSVAAEDFFQDLFTVDLAEDEMITAVRFPAVRSAAYAKLHQRASHYAIVGVASVLEMDGETCTSARIGITGLSTHAMRQPVVEAALVGQALTAEAIEAAATHAAVGIDDVNTDIHASADYRRAMAVVMARRAITAAAARR